MSQRSIKKAALLFGEGGKEVTFFNFLLKQEKFKFLENNWSFQTDHASGSSPKDVLTSCIERKNDERSFAVVLCFIDLDKLIHDFPDDHQTQKSDLETLAASENITIIWQHNDHEEELSRATDGRIEGKSGMKRRLEINKDRIMRSAYVKRIFQYFYGTTEN